jgi:hypothetical protein
MATLDAALKVRERTAAVSCALACVTLCAMCVPDARATPARPRPHHKRPACERTHRPRPRHRKRPCRPPAPGPVTAPPPPAAPPASRPPTSPPAQYGVLHFAARATPIVSNFKQSHHTWREGAKPVHISSARLPVGSVFSFTLNERARVAFTFTQRVSGRRVHGRCVAASSANRSAPSCKRAVIRGTLSFAGHAGANSVAFQGRLSSTHKLSPGVYELTIVATTATRQRSTPRTLGFTIAG